MLCSVLLSLILVATPTFSARILAIVSTPSYSHQIVFRPIWRELSLRGHQVTLLTTDPINDPTLTNLTEIDMGISYKKWKELNFNEYSKWGIFRGFKRAMKTVIEIMEEQLCLPQVQELIKGPTDRFDLVMMESLQVSTAVFAEKFGCPLIQLLSFDGSTFLYNLIGNPSHPILNPDLIFSLLGELNFAQRLTSVIGTQLLNLVYGYVMAPMQDELIKKHFEPNYSSLVDILRNTSMLFVNTDSVFHRLRPTYPNILQIGGGTHLTPPKELPKNLKTQLDNAKNGFIYFSLGTNVQSERLPENTRQVFLDTFAELPYLVLWKFEKEDLPGKPDNVIISKWFPQQDILRHPNIKLFITQGGLQSTEEGIYNHVPMIGVPFMGDQYTNVHKFVTKGMGIQIDYDTMNKDTLKAAILEVISNPRYRDNVKRLATLAKDEPMTGVERAVWWTEYVIRHKGAPHLRSPALNLPFYQYFLLDVVGFCLLVGGLIIYLNYRISKLIFRLLRKIVSQSKQKLE